ncbi:isopenicillin N synthase family dioxygenase [Sulfitobacter sabulilitoris]|uniref:2-oxoglutarate-dependent ethylene/succinate-forming enzyme n=1 Tax=Sulfitobacter sabulilitoris TaxID=2562655 RepID=A0A5S3PJ10_9RHOB|nr:2-oxoglutarate and iron-dependent oxygenase domain-containing protein [Sulfitobacter sabulilitoris]TMM54379.1 isopenicillin N synthase family oxygenase [Sulfitobacter sabulilitoris]
MIPRLDAAAIAAQDPATLAQLAEAATGVGFFTVHGTALSGARVEQAIETYRAFFHLDEAQKRAVDMAATGANRGWGRAGSEQVDPQVNPDYKQYFDCGFQVPRDDPRSALPVYAPNLWPDEPARFAAIIGAYYTDACAVAMDVLRGIAGAIGAPRDHFDQAFDTPMALLRGNFYPARPAWATDRDFGIATHTDYGCLTLLAMDGSPGLEVRTRGGGWIPVSAPPGEFVINFGEMMEMWTGGRVRATPHRVIGTDAERISVPLFFNPNVDTNVARMGSGEEIRAGDHLQRRFSETYVHLKTG